ncbi:MAG TPA: HPr family phosphocarrier protein [Hyphomicrobiaceae bacterium]|nr:HPr family phosphocarrier protein [Hyphomicrobiaceae bacterium]
MLENEHKLQARVTICNRKGLHARASAKFVKCAEAFDAVVNVRKDEHMVGGTSIMGLMSLAASPGTVLQLEAQGPEREQALRALVAMIEAGFGEER